LQSAGIDERPLTRRKSMERRGNKSVRIGENNEKGGRKKS